MKILLIFLIVFFQFQSYAQSYPSEDVTFFNGEVELSGTLSFPHGNGPFPALVLVAGSGAQDRDCNLMGFKMFEIMANHFNENGFAVMRYDERGVGESKGPSVMMSTTQDLSEDANAAVNTLLKHDKINKDAIGLLGHSEGGVIVPKVAVMNSEVDFIVLLAGYGVPGIQVSALQVRKALEADTTQSPQFIDAMVAANNKMIEYAMDDNLTKEERVERAAVAMGGAIEKMSEKQLSGIADKQAYAEAQAKAALAQLEIPWMRYYIEYDPAPTLAKVKVPILILFGDKDQQVTVDQNQQVMTEALAKGGNDQVTVKVIEGANHLFQKANTGSPNEYFSLPKEFIPELLPFITNWANTIVE